MVTPDPAQGDPRFLAANKEYLEVPYRVTPGESDCAGPPGDQQWQTDHTYIDITQPDMNRTRENNIYERLQEGKTPGAVPNDPYVVLIPSGGREREMSNPGRKQFPPPPPPPKTTPAAQTAWWCWAIIALVALVLIAAAGGEWQQ